MRIRALVSCGLVSVAVLVACAPKAPPPIMPEPVYDKYGNEVLSGGDGGACRDGRQSYGANDARASLPICAGSCGAGYAATANRQQCVPVTRDGGGDQQTGRDPQGSPTRG
ncbi:hypothetical protein [Pseudogemmobacter blasticus]|nr:hypothetical protein [Fuscovulum blasticum]